MQCAMWDADTRTGITLLTDLTRDIAVDVDKAECQVLPGLGFELNLKAAARVFSNKRTRLACPMLPSATHRSKA